MIDPKELKYTKDDEWVRFEGDEAYVGITDYAQSELGDLVFVNLPEVDDEVVAGEPFGDVESVKAVADVLCFPPLCCFPVQKLHNLNTEIMTGSFRMAAALHAVDTLR